MKILIIAKNVGRIAPGIVAERLINGLSEVHDLDVLSADYDPSITLNRVNKVIKLHYKEMNVHINRTFISIFSVNPIDIFFAKKAISYCDDKYDCIISFISSDHYISLMIGNEISKRQKIKHFAHFLDAVPAPGGWIKKNSYFYLGLKRFISRNLCKVHGLFSTNQAMLDYQLSTFNSQDKIITKVIYNPGFGKLQNYKECKSSQNTFVYTGGIYGHRKSDYVLKAFKNILIEYPNSTLEFVGSKLSDSSLSIFKTDELDKVIIQPFTRDLRPYYERCIALIDIDADLPNDVFVSSKIINYITIDRTIISVTGTNSPSRKLFKDINSILQCRHNEDEITDAMRKAIQQKNEMNFHDRDNVIKLFDINSITLCINNAIKK